MRDIIRKLKEKGAFTEINRHIPYAGFVGIEAFEDERGLVSVLRYRESNIGNTQLPALHGGVVGALLEHAAILHLLAAGDAFPKVINVSIDYLRPCRAVDTFARGTFVRQGRRIANVRVEAWQERPERPVAAAHAHFLLS